ncbi:MAG: tetratricopeptide repeat protein, partial [Aureliella sp.]
SGDGESARSLWDQALMLDPRSAEAYLDYGHYELNKGEFAKAADYFRAALRNAPATFEAHRLLGQALLAQGDAGGAAAEFDRFLTRAPQAPTEERAGAWAKLGNAYQRLGKFEEAARSYSMAFELEPTSSEAANGLLVAYRKLGQPEKSAQYAEVLERLSAPEPTVTDNREDRDVDLHKAQGVLDYTCQTSTTLLAKHGDMETAVRLLEEALAAAPRLDSLRSQLVTLHVRRGSDDDAIRVLTQGCEAEPENLQAWLGLAKFCMQRRRMGAAESALQKVIELEPEAADGYALLAQVQMTDNSTVHTAVATARQAVARLQSGGNYYILATALYHAGDRAGSREALLKALELEPANAEYRSALSRL